MPRGVCDRSFLAVFPGTHHKAVYIAIVHFLIDSQTVHKAGEMELHRLLLHSFAIGEEVEKQCRVCASQHYAKRRVGGLTPCLLRRLKAGVQLPQHRVKQMCRFRPDLCAYRVITPL